MRRRGLFLRLFLGAAFGGLIGGPNERSEGGFRILRGRERPPRARFGTLLSISHDGRTKIVNTHTNTE